MFCFRYLAVSGDVLTSVRKMEESLKRLKRNKAPIPNASGKLTDDDKIRIQFQIDVIELGDLVRH